MGHLDKRMDPDKDTDTSRDGPVKDGVSGNPPESTEYEKNKIEDLPDGPAPDVVGATDAGKAG